MNVISKKKIKMENYLPPEELENECMQCGCECEKDFCSKQCAEYWINE